MRVTRPTDLAAIAEMYSKGLGFTAVAGFKDHRGFDGVILGHAKQPYHIEFTSQRGQRSAKVRLGITCWYSTFPRKTTGEASCAQMISAGGRVSRRVVIQPILGRTGQDVRRYRWVSRRLTECGVDSVDEDGD
jgi:YycE-like protein